MSYTVGPAVGTLNPCRLWTDLDGTPHRSLPSPLLATLFAPQLPWRFLAQNPSSEFSRPAPRHHRLSLLPRGARRGPWSTTTSPACACASASPPRGAARGSPPACAPRAASRRAETPRTPSTRPRAARSAAATDGRRGPRRPPPPRSRAPRSSATSSSRSVLRAPTS